MSDMPRPRPPYLHRFRTRHGKFVWYVRRPGGNRIRIRAEYGTPDFYAAYQRAMEGHVDAPRCKVAAGSLQWLWDRYHETTAWAALSPATRRQRENIMAHVLKASGSEPFSAVTKAAVAAGRDRRAATPSQARNFLDCLRGLFKWAEEAGHVPHDPTAGVKNPPKRKTDGFPMWTDAEIARYQAHWPVGTKERVWFDVLRHTGLRRGDAATLGRQHVRDGIACIRTEKSRGAVLVTIAIAPELERTLKSGPCGELAFICGENGKPLTKESFGNLFREACRKAGVNKSAHGLRKALATEAVENDVTHAELKGMFGWTGDAMPSLYTKEADRSRLAKRGFAKLRKNSR
jgi:integrase